MCPPESMEEEGERNGSVRGEVREQGYSGENIQRDAERGTCDSLFATETTSAALFSVISMRVMVFILTSGVALYRR